jgi:phage virion morphogenesis protein
MAWGLWKSVYPRGAIPMNDDFLAVEEWAAGLLARLKPAERRRVNRAVALELRRNESQRIASQQEPDGSPFSPRHTPKNLRGKKGKIRRSMFARLRTARYLRVDATATDAVVGYTGRAARIAIIHQEGRLDRPGPGQSPVRYPRRRLIGFTQKSRERVLDALAQHLAGRKL